MDDLLLCQVVIPASDKVVAEHAADISAIVEPGATYHKNMIIKPEGTSTQVDCLGTRIWVGGDGNLHIRYLNKNELALKEIGRQKFLRFQHGANLVPRRQRIHIIMGELYRIARLTLDISDKSAQRGLLLHDFLSISYSASDFKMAWKKFPMKWGPEWDPYENLGPDGPPLA